MYEFNILKNIETGFEGSFDIYISSDEKIIFKKNRNKFLINRLNSKQNLIIYKDLLENLYKDEIIGNNVIKGFDVEDDGSYKCEYIEDGIRLDKILPHQISSDFLDNLISLQSNIKKVEGKIGGDWALHNLLYSPSRKKLLNIDLEGFFTNYKTLPNWGNIQMINKWFNEKFFINQKDIAKLIN